MKKQKIAKYTVQMSDEEMYDILNHFINSTSVAIGGDIKVEVSSRVTSMTPKDKSRGMKFEDTRYLDATLNGAMQFLLWMRRDGIYRKCDNE